MPTANVEGEETVDKKPDWAAAFALIVAAVVNGWGNVGRIGVVIIGMAAVAGLIKKMRRLVTNFLANGVLYLDAFRHA